MRTTIELEDHLLRKAKEYAARNHRSLTSLIEDALRELLGRASAPSKRVPVRLPRSGEAPGLCPGVDLDDSAGLLDRMERDDLA